MKTILRTAALLTLFACSRGDEAPAPNVEFSPAPSKPAAAPATGTAASPAATPAAAGAILLTSADGAKTITVVDAGGRVEVSISGGARYIGEQDGEKRRYRDAATGAAFVEVKTGDNGFKVRTPDSKLLWKVKIDTDKIKVSDNEENKFPWVLKTKYPDKAKIINQAEQEMGDVKYYRDTNKLKVKDHLGDDFWASESGRMSPAFGVVMMEGVPEQYRLIIMAELLARGI